MPASASNMLALPFLSVRLQAFDGDAIAIDGEREHSARSGRQHAGLPSTRQIGSKTPNAQMQTGASERPIVPFVLL
jgi:hypothetical protein